MKNYFDSLVVTTYNLVQDNRAALEVAGLVLSLSAVAVGVVTGVHSHWQPMPSDAHSGQPYLPYIAHPDPNSR